VKEFPNPGVDELIKSLKIVQPTWNTFKGSRLKLIAFTGGRPSMVDDATVKRTKAAITQAMKSDGSGFMAMLPGVVDTLVPSTWLSAVMKNFHFNHEFLDRRGFIHGRMAAMSGGDPSRMWRVVIVEFNGHMKTLKELLMYARNPETGAALTIDQLKEKYKDTEFAYTGYDDEEEEEDDD
jgi:hypothetical protein